MQVFKPLVSIIDQCLLLTSNYYMKVVVVLRWLNKTTACLAVDCSSLIYVHTAKLQFKDQKIS